VCVCVCHLNFVHVLTLFPTLFTNLSTAVRYDDSLNFGNLWMCVRSSSTEGLSSQTACKSCILVLSVLSTPRNPLFQPGNYPALPSVQVITHKVPKGTRLSRPQVTQCVFPCLNPHQINAVRSYFPSLIFRAGWTRTGFANGMYAFRGRVANTLCLKSSWNRMDDAR